ncbi:MAG: hypothetical protein OCD03_09485 [Hyphomicrobiales bacterium]
MSKFNRYLSDNFLNALEELSEAKPSNWWQDVLADKDLVIAVRTNNLDVYYKGMSIFNIKLISGRVVPATNLKYLTQIEDTRIQLSEDNNFNYTQKPICIEKYIGNACLEEIKKRAGKFASVEGKGIHKILIKDRSFIDVEISLASEDIDGSDVTRRIDIAIIQNKDKPIITFVEAKDFSNKEILPNSEKKHKDIHNTAVLNQIKGYNKALVVNEKEMRCSYLKVAQALVKIEDMRKNIQDNYELPKGFEPIRIIAKNNMKPEINPKCNLLVFGFNASQRDQLITEDKTVLELLEDELSSRIHSAQNPTTFVSSKKK